MPEKSRVAAGILGIFLGCLGIHKFYLGIPTAIVHLIVGGGGLGLLIVASVVAAGAAMTMSYTGLMVASIATLLLIVGWLIAAVSGIVGFIEGILYLTKSDEDFHSPQIHHLSRNEHLVGAGGKPVMMVSVERNHHQRGALLCPREHCLSSTPRRRVPRG